MLTLMRDIFLLNLSKTKSISKILISNYSSKKQNLESIIPKNVLNKHFTAASQPDMGAIYDKKPFKMVLEKDKVYFWCACGRSKNQPFCDGTHKSIFLKIKLKPVRFAVDETKDYWLCNCKQTSNRPFCDGTHKETRIQEAVK